MIITIASFKGGVAKTTTAVHLACYLEKHRAPTLLVDGDPNRSASHWAGRGELPVKVIDERHAVKFAGAFENVVIDTEARPDPEDLRVLADGCDLLIIPTTPDALALDALLQTIEALGSTSAAWRLLLTIVPPAPSRDEEHAREMLAEFPTFDTGIGRLVAFQRAALDGVPVYAVRDPRASRGWADYCRIGDALP